MSREFEITEANGVTWVYTPYHPDFVNLMHDMGAKWDSEEKAWKSKVLDANDFREAMKKVYFRTDAPCETVTVKITARDELYMSSTSYVWGDRQLCRLMKNNKVELCDDVVIVDDSMARANGYEKGIAYIHHQPYLHVTILKGTVFKLSDVPKAAVDHEIELDKQREATEGEDRNWEIEIVSTNVNNEMTDAAIVATVRASGIQSLEELKAKLES